VKGIALGAALILAVSADHMQSSAATSQDRLTGTWTLRLQVEREGYGPAEPQHRMLTAELALLSTSAPGVRPWMAVSSFTHYGVYAGSVEELTPAATSRERVPLAAAKLVGRDSAEIVLNPTVDHGAVVLRGVLRDSTITGNWTTTGYVMGKSGNFRMTLRQ